jgi:hypothetical protein
MTFSNSRILFMCLQTKFTLVNDVDLAFRVEHFDK